ncbi:uncharacterized protein LOC129249937 [Anastrepha obliqua]|uniref:uncharacterized protein LOC129249937 n=1 Tax=Anastrepha obliqua TaxID=95512 RepID=UPI0024099BEE|nr:uncharacterized protein LOC129249937 [Anastrepha obliqua]
MNRLTPEQRLQIVQIYYENKGSVRATHRALRPIFGRHNRPSESLIRLTMDRFRTTFALVDNTHPQRRRTVRTEDAIAAVEQSIEEDPNESIRHRAQQLQMCPSTLWKILRKDLGLRAAYSQFHTHPTLIGGKKDFLVQEVPPVADDLLPVAYRLSSIITCCLLSVAMPPPPSSPAVPIFTISCTLD